MRQSICRRRVSGGELRQRPAAFRSRAQRRHITEIQEIRCHRPVDHRWAPDFRGFRIRVTIVRTVFPEFPRSARTRARQKYSPGRHVRKRPQRELPARKLVDGELVDGESPLVPARTYGSTPTEARTYGSTPTEARAARSSDPRPPSMSAVTASDAASAGLNQVNSRASWRGSHVPVTGTT